MATISALSAVGNHGDPGTISTLALGRAMLGLLPEAPGMLRASLKVHALHANSRQSIGSLLQKQARFFPEKTALLFEDMRWSYHDFNAWVNRIAHVLQAQGVRSGDSVGLLLENHPELLACVAALAKIGAVAGLLNPNQRGEALRYSVGVIRPTRLLVGANCQATLRAAFPRRSVGMPWLWVGQGQAPKGQFNLSAACAMASTSNLPGTARILASKPCYFVFTSGTTGRPKAAVMTHLRWLRCGYGMGQAAMRLQVDDILYCPLPLHHNSALTLCWSSVVASAATLAIARKFSASGFWDDIHATGATAFAYIGELCRYLLSRPASPGDRQHHIRLMVGNGLRPEIWDAFQQRFGIRHICEFYGSSEGNLVFANALGLPHTAGMTTMPYAILAYDTERAGPQRDAHGAVRRVATGEVGLLVTEVSPRNPFDGYTDVHSTQAKMLHNVFHPGDSWINSADLVRDQGFRHIAFVDRLGDSFRWKGENVAASEVERAVATVPGIAQVCVYGVPVPHCDGRAGMAAVVLVAHTRFNGQRLAQQLRRHLPTYALPLFVRVMAAQSTTDTFKIQKGLLQQEGFNPAASQDPLYVLLQAGRNYVALSAILYRRILAGSIRL
jgi:acyl-CoA synthetase (AMP-forming)/AMP-acid ligase II